MIVGIAAVIGVGIGMALALVGGLVRGVVDRLLPAVLLAGAAAGASASDPSDLCDAAARIHIARCADGDQASCDWLYRHGASSGVCQ